MTAIIDSMVLIDASRGLPQALALLDMHAGDIIASEVTRIELLQGARARELDRIEELMDLLEWIPVFEEVSRRAGQLGNAWLGSHSGIDVPDLIIAASAQISGAQLATLNVKHFPMFPGLEAAY